MAEANALRGGTEEHVPTVAETTASKARAARASKKDLPTAEANALCGGTEEHVTTAAVITSKARRARTSEERTARMSGEDMPTAEASVLRGAKGRADTLGLGGSAAHMVDMARRSDLAEGRAYTSASPPPMPASSAPPTPGPS